MINVSKYHLTTDHPASSYGRPVLIDNKGNVIGLSDIVEHAEPSLFAPWSEDITGEMIAYNMLTEYPEQRDVIRKYLGVPPH
jgi:hypothetical protein